MINQSQTLAGNSPERSAEALQFSDAMVMRDQSAIDAMSTTSLIKFLKEGDSSLASMAASILGARGTVSAVPALIETLKEINDGIERKGEPSSVRIGDATHILLALERLGKSSESATPEIARSLMLGQNAGEAAKALQAIGTPRAIDALLQAAALPEDALSRSGFAADALGKLPQSAEVIVPRLNQIFFEKEHDQLQSSYLRAALSHLGWSVAQQDWTAAYKESKVAYDLCKPFEGHFVQFTDNGGALHSAFLKKVECKGGGLAVATVAFTHDGDDTFFVLGERTQIRLGRQPARVSGKLDW